MCWRFIGALLGQGNPMPEALLIDAADAAERLGISRALLYAMHSDGRLGPLPLAFGRRKLWRVAELAAWVASDPPCPPRAAWTKRNLP